MHNNDQEYKGPLTGVRIIDFTRLLPGPLATMHLADLGAEVIKVEAPDKPDYIRYFEPAQNGISYFYLALNRNKKSLAINYGTDPGKAIIHDLVKTADVFVEQFRPGVMEQIGLGYFQLSAINPRLIYVSITGYGQDSSLAQAAGHDLNYTAISGVLGINGTNDEVVMPGFQLADIAGGGYSAVNAVTAALYQREKTGKGEWIDVSMTDASVPFITLQHAAFQANQLEFKRGNFQLSGSLANYNVYKCKDGKHLALGSLEPKFWANVCAALEKPEWGSKMFLQGEELKMFKHELKETFLQKNREEWLGIFRTADACVTSVNSVSEAEKDPLLNERRMFLENEHPVVGKYKTINQPLKFKTTFFENNHSAPDLGAHSASILQSLNYTTDQIEALVQQKVIKVI